MTTQTRDTTSAPALPPSRRERAEAGRAARAALPPEAHAEVAGDPRPDPIDVLERQAARRVPELVPIRYGRMLASPFAFYRGGAALMAGDLGRVPATNLRVQLCGDAHLLNFGLFGSPERRLVFDLNDFDETLPGPFEWDVKRLAASVAVAGREIGASRKRRRVALRASIGEYRLTMRRFAEVGTLAVWYAQADVEQLRARLAEEFTRHATDRALAKAKARDGQRAYARLVRVVDGRPRIAAVPPLIVPIEDLLPDHDADALLAALGGIVRAYRRTLQPDRRHLLDQYRLVHLARKVVGIGSVGTRTWVLLLIGTDDADPLVLQAKEAQPAVHEPYAGHSRHGSQGQRVVAGQRLMQAASDIFLGWHSSAGVDGIRRDYYLRQLSDWKASVAVTTMTPATLTAYARMCAWALARAHARSGDRVAIAAYLGSSDRFEQAVADFAEAYADVNAADHDALREATDTGRVAATSGI